MKVLLVIGSPHVKGCTGTALEEIAETLQEHEIETEFFHLGTKPVRGCIACQRCHETGYCAFDDDPANTLIDKIKAADGVIIGSPVYYGSANGALCALLDRVFFAASSQFYYKPAAAVVSCRRGGAGNAFDRLNKYFTISQMPVVTSQYWNSIHGMSREEALRDQEGLQIMRTLGRNMAWMLKSMAKSKAVMELPVREDWTPTNFIR